MRYNHNILLFLILFLIPCCHPNVGKPIIPEDKMSNIVADFYLMQSTLSQFDLPSNERRPYYYAQILEKYGYTEAEFDSSLVWYTQHFDVFENVYDNAYKILEQKKDSLEKTINVPPTDVAASPTPSAQ